MALRERNISIDRKSEGPRDWYAYAAVKLFILLACMGLPLTATAVSCTSQSELAEAERASLMAAARHFGSLIQAGNVAGVRAETIPAVASQFAGIGSEITTLAPLTSAAVLTVLNVYDLNASDLTAPEDQTQFFCGGQNAPEVVFSIPQIPPGRYGIAILHATGVAQPQQITFIFAQQAAPGSASAPKPGPAADDPATGPWLVAGLYARPMVSAGHDGLWYWNRARDFAKVKQNWNAYFYYQTAETVLVPVDFVSTPNLDKLIKEQSAVAPESLPGEKPMTLSVGGHSYSITALHTDATLGWLDLVIAYQGGDNSDPVAARTRNVDLMQAILTQHPELRTGFHGLWVYSNAANQRTFANELPMAQIPCATSTPCG